MSREGFEDEAPIRRRKLAGQSRPCVWRNYSAQRCLIGSIPFASAGFRCAWSAHQCAAPGSSGCDQSWRRRCSSAEARPQHLVTATSRRASEYSVWQTRGNFALPALRQRLHARQPRGRHTERGRGLRATCGRACAHDPRTAAKRNARQEELPFVCDLASGRRRHARSRSNSGFAYGARPGSGPSVARQLLERCTRAARCQETHWRSRLRQPRLVTIRARQTTRNAIWLLIQTATYRALATRALGNITLNAAAQVVARYGPPDTGQPFASHVISAMRRVATPFCPEGAASA